MNKIKTGSPCNLKNNNIVFYYDNFSFFFKVKDFEDIANTKVCYADINMDGYVDIETLQKTHKNITFPKIFKDYRKILEHIQSSVKKAIKLKIAISSYLSSRNLISNIDDVLQYIKLHHDKENFLVKNDIISIKEKRYISLSDLYLYFKKKEVTEFSFRWQMLRKIPSSKHIKIPTDKSEIYLHPSYLISLKEDDILSTYIDFEKIAEKYTPNYKKHSELDIQILDKKYQDDENSEIGLYLSTFFNCIEGANKEILKEKMELQIKISKLKKESENKLKKILDK